MGKSKEKERAKENRQFRETAFECREIALKFARDLERRVHIAKVFAADEDVKKIFESFQTTVSDIIIAIENAKTYDSMVDLDTK